MPKHRTSDWVTGTLGEPEEAFTGVPMDLLDIVEKGARVRNMGGKVVASSRVKEVVHQANKGQVGM